MITWRNGTVSGLRRQWPGAIELDVSVDGTAVRALAYPALTGLPQAGDRVLLNTTALDLGLGTGGYALVVAIPDRLPADPQLAGHLVKARYTPLQAIVAGADEQGSPHHDVLRDADDIGGMPVVVADLHSALPAVLAGVLDEAERAGDDGSRSVDRVRVAYVMQDGGALPAWFSRACAALKDAGWLAATITTGQAFGGDLETVTVHTGLLAARHVLGADIAVVAQGPGNLGTGTRWGFSGVAAGEAVNAVAALGGRAGGLPAGQRGRRARASPGRLASQPDGVRPGGAGPGGCRGPRPARAVRRPGRGPGGRAGRAARDRHRAGRRPRGSPAGQPGPAVHDGPRAWTRTPRTSSPRRQPGRHASRLLREQSREPT